MAIIEPVVHAIDGAVRVILATRAQHEAEVTAPAVSRNLLTAVLVSTPANTVKRKARSIIATKAIIQVINTLSTLIPAPAPAKIIITVVSIQVITAASVGRIPILGMCPANLPAASAVVVQNPITRRSTATQIAVPTQEPDEDIGDINRKRVVCK